MAINGGWIKDAIKKPGSLRKTLGVKKGEKIPKAKLDAAAKEKGVTGQRARLAKTLQGFNNKKSLGGLLTSKASQRRQSGAIMDSKLQPVRGRKNGGLVTKWENKWG